eukprot:CFRG3696T1
MAGREDHDRYGPPREDRLSSGGHYERDVHYGNSPPEGYSQPSAHTQQGDGYAHPPHPSQQQYHPDIYDQQHLIPAQVPLVRNTPSPVYDDVRTTILRSVRDGYDGRGGTRGPSSLSPSPPPPPQPRKLVPPGSHYSYSPYESPGVYTSQSSSRGTYMERGGQPKSYHQIQPQGDHHQYYKEERGWERERGGGVESDRQSRDSGGNYRQQPRTQSPPPPSVGRGPPSPNDMRYRSSDVAYEDRYAQDHHPPLPSRGNGAGNVGGGKRGRRVKREGLAEQHSWNRVIGRSDDGPSPAVRERERRAIIERPYRSTMPPYAPLRKFEQMWDKGGPFDWEGPGSWDSDPTISRDSGGGRIHSRSPPPLTGSPPPPPAPIANSLYTRERRELQREGERERYEEYGHARNIKPHGRERDRERGREKWIDDTTDEERRFLAKAAARSGGGTEIRTSAHPRSHGHVSQSYSQTRTHSHPHSHHGRHGVHHRSRSRSRSPTHKQEYVLHSDDKLSADCTEYSHTHPRRHNASHSRRPMRKYDEYGEEYETEVPIVRAQQRRRRRPLVGRTLPPNTVVEYTGGNDDRHASRSAGGREMEFEGREGRSPGPILMTESRSNGGRGKGKFTLTIKPHGVRSGSVSRKEGGGHGQPSRSGGGRIAGRSSNTPKTTGRHEYPPRGRDDELGHGHENGGMRVSANPHPQSRENGGSGEDDDELDEEASTPITHAHSNDSPTKKTKFPKMYAPTLALVEKERDRMEAFESQNCDRILRKKFRLLKGISAKNNSDFSRTRPNEDEKLHAGVPEILENAISEIVKNETLSASAIASSVRRSVWNDDEMDGPYTDDSDGEPITDQLMVQRGDCDCTVEEGQVVELEDGSEGHQCEMKNPLYEEALKTVQNELLKIDNELRSLNVLPEDKGRVTLQLPQTNKAAAQTPLLRGVLSDDDWSDNEFGVVSNFIKGVDNNHIPHPSSRRRGGAVPMLSSSPKYNEGRAVRSDVYNVLLNVHELAVHAHRKNMRGDMQADKYGQYSSALLSQCDPYVQIKYGLKRLLDQKRNTEQSDGSEDLETELREHRHLLHKRTKTDGGADIYYDDPSMRKIVPGISVAGAGANTSTGGVAGVRITAEEMHQRNWKLICTRELPRAYKQRVNTHNANVAHLRRVAQLCQREVLARQDVRKPGQKAMRSNRDTVSRSRRLMKGVLSYWRAHEKEERELRKKAEKEELEKAKAQEDLREAKRQQRKLNFLITQTELFAHFIGKKTGQNDEETNENDILDQLTSEGGEVTAKGGTDVDGVEVEGDESMRERATKQAQAALAATTQRTKEFDIANGGKNGAMSQEDIDAQMSFAEGGTEALLPQPPSFKGGLKSYQLKGMSWLVNLYQQGINGILADEMGLGKTVQTIALMSYLADFNQIWGPFLIVAPLSTVHNWQQELVKFNPNLKVLPYWGTPAQRKIIRKDWTHKQVHNKDASFHVLITSYTFVVSDAAYFNRLKWQYMVLDEAQAIKSSSSIRWKVLLEMNCRNRLLLTGTPIQNSMAELWALLHFIMPQLFDSHDEFNEWFSKDIENAAEAKDGKLDQTQLKRLHMILKPFMLRRLKRDVQHELGEKIEVEIDCSLTARQRRLYEGLKQKISIEDLLTASSEASASRSTTEMMSKHLMNLVMQFRKVCNHPNLFERRNMESSYRFRHVAILPNPHDEIKVTAGRRHFELDSAVTDANPISLSLPRLLFDDPVSVATTGMSEKEALILKHFDIRSPRHINTSDVMRAMCALTSLSPSELALDLRGGLLQRVLTALKNMENQYNALHLYGQDAGENDVQSDFRVRTPLETIHLLRSGAQGLGTGLGGSVGSGADLAKIPARARVKIEWCHTQFRRILPAAVAQPIYPDVCSMRYRNLLLRQCSASDPWVNRLLYGNIGVTSHAHAHTQAHMRAHTWTPTQTSHISALPPNFFTIQTETSDMSLGNPFTCSPIGSETSVRVATNGLFNAAAPPNGWNFVLPPDKAAIILESDKMKCLDKLLLKLRAEDHRVLIYSQMTKMIDILEEYMQLKRIKYMRLDGSSKVEDRRDMVADFQTNTDTFVFLLSTRAGGLGINLTAADTVIFYDSDWNPTVDQQAMDRAHRVGQTKQVTVYRLVTKGTIEERILQRAKQKSEIQRMVISGGKQKQSAGNMGDAPKASEVVSLLIDDKDLEDRLRAQREAKKKAEKEARDREREKKKLKRLEDQNVRRETAARQRKENRELRAATKQTTRKKKTPKTPVGTTPGNDTPVTNSGPASAVPVPLPAQNMSVSVGPVGTIANESTPTVVTTTVVTNVSVNVSGRASVASGASSS